MVDVRNLDPFGEDVGGHGIKNKQITHANISKVLQQIFPWLKGHRNSAVSSSKTF